MPTNNLDSLFVSEVFFCVTRILVGKQVILK